MQKIRLQKHWSGQQQSMDMKGGLFYSKEQKNIDTFEMWCYRRLLRISWT